MSYDGPIFDTYFHPDWSTKSHVLGDQKAFLEDPMRKRMMKTFKLDERSAAAAPATTKADARPGIAGTVAEMDSAGVERAILQATLQYPTPRATLERGVAEHFEIINAYPGRFEHSGTILPPPQGPASYWDLLEPCRIVEEHQRKYGIVGVHLLNAAWGTPPNDKYYYPLYAKCVELGLAVFSYVGIPGPLWPTLPNYPLFLDDVALAFPELTIIAHHIGDPWVKMMCHLSAKHPNLYIQTSAWSPKAYPAELLEFMAGKWHGTRGEDKVLFATDHPFLNVTRGARDARALKLSATTLEKFMYLNANALFPRK